jgi:glycosyltransferase involved in cell wall biosynthesis
MSGNPAGQRLTVSLDVSAVPSRPAGAGRYVVELARALSASGECDLTLVARQDDAGRWRQTAPAAATAAVAPSPRPARLVYEQLLLGKALQRFAPPPRVHHGPHYTMPRGAKIPCVVTVHDLTFFDHPEWHERSKVLFFRSAIRFAARNAAGIVCVSRATAAKLQATVPPACPVSVVSHGVDSGRFAACEPGPGADGRVLERFGLAAPYVLHVGTLEPRKGLADLVAAFESLSGRHGELDLVLAGGAGWHNRTLEDAIARSRSASRIRRLGYVPEDDLPSLLRKAGAVAYPSLEEGFGLPALEALACGAPLVTTSGTAMAEVAGDSAVLVEAGQPEALARAIEEAIAGRGTASGSRRREAGIEIAARHTWADCAARHLEAYRRACGADR